MPQMRCKNDSGLTLEVDSALLAGFVGEVGGTTPLIGKPSGIGGVEERSVVDLVGILMPVTVLTVSEVRWLQRIGDRCDCSGADSTTGRSLADDYLTAKNVSKQSHLKIVVTS